MKARIKVVIGVVAGAAALALVGSTSSTAAPLAPAPRATASVANVITPPTEENHFVAITGCRIIDTRVAGGVIGTGATRAFYVGGTSGFVGQGGTSGGCGIPTSAVSISATVTAVTPGATGFLKAWPSANAEPAHATVLTFYGNQGTGATQAITPTAGQALKVRNFGANVNIVIDVNGYYVPPMAGLVFTGTNATDGQVYSGSPRLLSVTWVSTGVADVTMDRDVTYCTAMASGYYDNVYYANAKAFNGNKIRVFTWYVSSTTHLAVPVNNYVYVSVNC